MTDTQNICLLYLFLFSTNLDLLSCSAEHLVFSRLVRQPKSHNFRNLVLSLLLFLSLTKWLIPNQFFLVPGLGLAKMLSTELLVHSLPQRLQGIHASNYVQYCLETYGSTLKIWSHEYSITLLSHV